MDKLNELVFLLPDYELEGFPRSLPNDQAGQVLSGWVGLWHPVLMCGAGRIPRWHQASRLPSELLAIVFVLPPISKQVISASAAEEIAQAGGLLLEPEESWEVFQDRLVAQFPGLEISSLAHELRPEFAALGYAFLQVQLMTRQLRYTSNLDVAMFEEQVLIAAEAAMDNDAARARQYLQSAFDALGQERDHYYSNEAHLLDVTLLADTTLGKSLDRQLSDPAPTSFIASANMLRKLGQKSPECLQILRERITQQTACVAGGMDSESPWPLMPREAMVRDLQRAPEAYRELQFEPPTVFARLSFGLTADAPSLLSKFGFRGAVLMAFTSGKYPSTSQPKISWESSDGSRIPAITGEPLDANSHVSLLALGWSIGEALDRQHVPTLVFGHWPSRTSPYYQLLQIVASRTPALGRFKLLDQYFVDTTLPYHHERLDPGGFQFNWLAESDIPAHLLTLTKNLHVDQCRLNSLLNIANLIYQLENTRNKAQWPADETGVSTPIHYSTVPTEKWALELEAIAEQLNQLRSRQFAQVGQLEVESAEIEKQLADLIQAYLERLAGLLTKKSNVPKLNSDTATGRLLFNPRSNPVRVIARTQVDQPIVQTQKWNFANGRSGNERWTCIDLPSMGFVVAPFAHSTSKSPDTFVLAEPPNTLQNEFIEAQIDASRGHLRSLHAPAKRGNRLSVMVAYREKHDSEVVYSEMVASRVSIQVASNVHGVVRAEGHIQWQGKLFGDFCIDYHIRRGSRILSANIALSNLKYTDERNPWLSAFVLRVAWPTEAAILRTYPYGRRHTWSGIKTVASDLIEIDEVDYQTHYLTGGLAFHTRQQSRFLESILAVSGQSQVNHRVGFAVDLPYPLPTAQQFLDQPYQLPLTGQMSAANGWLVEVDCKNVQVELQCPLQDDQGRVAGIRIVVMELNSRSTTAKIQFFQDIVEAHRIDFGGNKLSRVATNGDTLTIPLSSGEHAIVDLLWQA
jgi:alpha-mannosidase